MPPKRAALELHAIISGQVQRVGFRSQAQKYATKLGLTGSVSNLANGSVEIYAQGTKEQLTQLLQLLKQDAGRGSVENMTTDFYVPTRTYTDFVIVNKD